MAYTSIPAVSNGQVVDPAWGNAVDSAVTELQAGSEALAFTPAGNTDGSTGGYTNWVTLGNISIPTWCTSVLVSITCTGIHSLVAASSYTLRARIGAGGPASNGEAQMAWQAVSTRLNGTIIGSIASPSTGTQSLIVQAERTAGTGQIRADVSSRFGALVIYRG